MRGPYGLHHFAILRHIALSLLKQGRATQVGSKGKRLKAGWDHAYLLHLRAYGLTLAITPK